MNFKLKEFETPIVVQRIANIHYFEFTNEYHTKRDYHNFCELVYVDKGIAQVEAEGFIGILKDNELIIHRPNEIHSLKCVNNIAPNIIIIGFECFSDVLSPFSVTPTLLSSEQKKMLAEIMKEGMSVYAPPYDMPYTLNMKKRDSFPFGADQLIKLKLEAFLISLVRTSMEENTYLYENPSPTACVIDVCQYINEHYTEKITLDNLCFIFGTNKTSLCRDFKNQQKITIVEYINKLKVKESKKLIRENNLSITEISEMTGFNSVHYFCKVFKKIAGQTPKDYLATIQSKLNL